MTTIREQRAAVQPPPGTPILYRQGGRDHWAHVCYRLVPGALTFEVRDDVAPYACADLMVGDPRIIEPAKYGPNPPEPRTR